MSVAVVDSAPGVAGAVVPAGIPGPGFVVSLDAVSVADCSDDELLEVMAAWRRVTSWAQASELAVVAEFVRRREQRHRDSPAATVGEFIADEIALALTLSGGAAGLWAGLAGKLADAGWFPLTARALAEGHIDLTRAKAIVDGLFGVDPGTIALVEAAVIEDARVMNAARVRRRVREALVQADPQAAERREQRARKVRSLQMWATAAGTCDLALREVSVEDAEAIYNKINAVAHAMKADGDVRPVDAIRHDLGIALLRGTPLPAASRGLRHDQDDGENPYARDHDSGHADAVAGPDDDGSGRTGTGARAESGAGACDPEGDRGRTGRRPRSADASDQGSSGDAVTMTALRLTELLQGVIDEQLALSTGRHRAVELRTGLRMRIATAMRAMTSALADLKLLWCDATTGKGGGTARGRVAASREHGAIAPDGAKGRAEPGGCGVHGHDGYRPPAGMRRLVQRSYRMCAFPSCNREATRCDLDHTVAFHKGGPTCSCNLSPLCRHHHKLKQDPQWHLFQPWPGLLVWVTPAGKWHTVIPEDRQ